ncbi:hypothetical protein EE612_020002 [Oryza sativa]|nr:hypothetical protein EE612_020002 [Oryza sativa]
MPSSNTSPRHAARAPMALSCAAECALSLACARWALRRLSLSGADDSASWPAASPSSFAPVPRACRSALAAWQQGHDEAEQAPTPAPSRARRTASPTTARAGRSCSPCAGWDSRGSRTTACSSTPAGPSRSRAGTRTAGSSAPPCGCSTGRAPRSGGWWRRPGRRGAGSCSSATRSAPGSPRSRPSWR